jgi:hypothetical protein
MRKIYFFEIALIIITNTVNGQIEGLLNINKNDLKAYMSFFASDEMKGRETGTAENEIASLYIKTNIMQMGLKPIPETGEYLQKVPLVSSEIKAKETYIRINDLNGNNIFTSDSIIYLMTPLTTADITAKFVFAGFGFTDTVNGYDDYKGIELKDKIVLIMTGSPQSADPDELNNMFNIALEGPKIMSAFHHGAKAILIVYDPRSKYQDAYASGLSDIGAPSTGTKMYSLNIAENAGPIQVAFITRNTANILLKQRGYDLKTIQEKIVNEKKPASIELDGITVSFRTYIETLNISINNVIGMVEGSDPVLKNECVIYTAHFDHIGTKKNGDVFNGADDNASGSMALLEVAQAFINLKKKPLRTIVFAWVNAEEKGLLGSKYYTENSVFPMEKTVLDINLDMVGRSKMPSDTGKFMGYDVKVSQQGEILMYTDQKGKDILELIESKSKEAGIKAINMGKDPVLGSSDYASFRAKDVPTICFNSGEYPDLHTIRDDIDKIDFDKMERVSKMVFLLGYEIANQKKRFVPVTVN